MADIRAFRGIRPRADLVAEIAALPYDVLSRDEVIATMTQHPRTFLRVTRADAELDPSIDRLDPRVFVTSRENLQTMLTEGWLVQDGSPCLYLYEQTMGQHRQVGLVAGAALADYASGLIKRHEKTRERELEDRTRHIEAVGANTGPAFLTYRARPAIDAIVASECARTPIYDFVADDRIRHRFWVITAAESIARLTAELKQVEAVYIADGHHRTAASAKVCERYHERHPGSSDSLYDHYMAVFFPHDQLQILPYNRVIADRNGLTTEALLAAINNTFEVTPAKQAIVPTEPKTFGMYMTGQWYLLRARPQSYAGLDVQRTLDVAILQEHLLEPILGIGNPRTDPRICFIGGIRPLSELEHTAAAEGVAFTLCPVTIEEVMAIADAGEVMPPKSTWFEPKLRSGMVLRAFDTTLSGRPA